MCPYYQKTFTLAMPSPEMQAELGLKYVNKQVSGSQGPIHASFPDAIEDPIARSWIQSMKGLGYTMTTDPFSGNALGAYTNAATIHPIKKIRSYAANVYYEPVMDRNNLKVETSAMVEKIIFDTAVSETGPLATGVQFMTNSGTHIAKARKEVILSAGTFNSPKILELSGIGNKYVISKLGIPLLAENPNMGENLQDHVLSGMSFEVQDFIKTKDDLMRREPTAVGEAMESYRTRQFGPFTVAGNYSSALLPTKYFHTKDGHSCMKEILQSGPTTPPGSFDEDLARYVETVLLDPQEASGGYFTYPAQADFKGSGAGADVIKTKLAEDYITIAVILLHPLSHGSTYAVSSEPNTSPEIDPRYLSHPLDLRVLAHHTQYIEKIAASPPLSGMFKPGGKRTPGVPRDLRKVSFEEVKDYVRGAAKSAWHPVGTCSIMPKQKGGVVDARLRVHSVHHLRVVDASVIPIIPRGNSRSSVYAIAERAADLFKEDWKLT